METELVLDASEYTRDIPVATFRRLRRAGVRGFIGQIWGGGYVPGRHNVHFRQHMEAAYEAGITDLAAYVWPPADWKAALQFAGNVPMAWVGLDVEAGARVTRAHVDGVLDAGQLPIIYTGMSAWRTIMGNSITFGDVPLWLARYPIHRLNATDPTTMQTEIRQALGRGRLGGWTQADVWAWQFQNTTYWAGDSFDLNLVRKDSFMMLEELAKVRDQQKVTALFLQAAGAASEGKQPPRRVRDAIKWLVGSW